MPSGQQEARCHVRFFLQPYSCDSGIADSCCKHNVSHLCHEICLFDSRCAMVLFFHLWFCPSCRFCWQWPSVGYCFFFFFGTCSKKANKSRKWNGNLETFCEKKRQKRQRRLKKELQAYSLFYWDVCEVLSNYTTDMKWLLPLSSIGQKLCFTGSAAFPCYSK